MTDIATRGPGLSMRDYMVEKTENDAGSVHSYTKEEKMAIVDHINFLLKDDPDLKDMIPINSDSNDIFEAVKSGTLLCKLINAIEPGTISRGLINVKAKLNRYEITENHVAALRFARQLGLHIVNMGPTDFMDGKAFHLVLGLLWQLVRVSFACPSSHAKLDLLSRVGSIAQSQQLDFLDEDGDLIPEDILLRWFNHHLKLAQHPRTVTNFSSDIRDSENYTVLLHQLAPLKCSLAPLEEKDLEKRAELFLQNAGKLDCRKFINARDVVSGNSRLNTAFVANLFASFHRLEPVTPSVPEPEEEEPPVGTEEEEVAYCESQIARLQKELEESEREAALKEEIIQEAMIILENRAQSLKEELDQERAKTSQIYRNQDSEIEALKSKLRALQAENNSRETEEDIRNKILKEEASKLELVSNQRALESRLDSLQDQLEEKVEVREELERRKKKIEEETRKMKLHHQSQLERLKHRLVQARQTEEELAQELEGHIATREVKEDELFQAQRKERNLKKELGAEQSHRQRIEQAKRKLEGELNKAKTRLEEEKELQAHELRHKVKLSTKLDKLTQEAQALRLAKTDIRIARDVLDGAVEELKDQLALEGDQRVRLAGEKREIEEEVDELVDETEAVAAQRVQHRRRLVRQQHQQLDRLQHQLHVQQQKAAQPLLRLSEATQEQRLLLQEHIAQQDSLQDQQRAYEGVQTTLAKDLFESHLAVEELKGATKELEGEERKQRTAVQETSAAQRRAAAEEHRLAKTKLRLRREGAEYSSAAQRSAAAETEAELEIQRLRSATEAEQNALRRYTKTAENTKAKLEQEEKALQETEEEAEIRLAQLREGGAAQISRTAADLQRRIDRSSAARRRAAEGSEAKEKEIEEQREAADRSEAAAKDLERQTAQLERRLAAERTARAEGEKAKDRLEAELAKAQQYMQSDRSKVKPRKDRERRSDRRLTTAVTAKEIEALQLQSQEVEEKLKAKRSEFAELDRPKSTQVTKAALEAQLADLTSEFELDSKKLKSRQKPKDETRKKSKKTVKEKEEA